MTGAFDGIVSLGELTAEQIASAVMPGQVTLSFDSPIQSGKGANFAVFENGFGFANTGKLFAELAFAEVSADGTDFLRFSSILPTPNLIEPFKQLAIGGLYDTNNVIRLLTLPVFGSRTQSRRYCRWAIFYK